MTLCVASVRCQRSDMQPKVWRGASRRGTGEHSCAGTWPDPESFYETVPFATRIDTAAVAEDRERLASIPYNQPVRLVLDRGQR